MREWFLLFALAAPLAALPGQAARWGEWSWVGLCLGGAVLAGVSVCWERNGDYAEALEEATGKVGGILYYIWCVLLAALTAGTAVDALSRTDEAMLNKWGMALALAAVAAYVLGKGTGGVLRWGKVMGAGCIFIIVGFLILGLWPGRWEFGEMDGAEWRGLGSAGDLLAAGSLGALGGFLPQKKDRGVWRWRVGWWALAVGVCAVTFGALGTRVAAKAELPFFLALQGLGKFGAFQRLEAVGTAVWSLGYLALMLLCGVSMERLRPGRWNRWVLAGAAALGGVALSNEAVREFGAVLYGMNLLFGAVGPAGVAIWRKTRAGKPGNTRVFGEERKK